MDILLQPRQPFSFTSVMYSHGWIRLAPFREDDDGASLHTLAVLRSGRVADLHIADAAGDVRVTTSAALDDAEIEEVTETVRWMLGLDQDLAAFYARCQHEPKLANAEREAKGRMLRSPTFFEDIVKTILTTNTSWSGTIRMVDALVGEYGEPLDESGERRAFPTPASLSRANEPDLRNVAKLGYRAPYVLEFAQRTESGDLDPEVFKHSDLATLELRKRILEIKGVGGYAAASLLMLLGRYDYLPVDSWARKMVSQEWYDGQPVGEPEIQAAFESWDEWKGLAYWFWEWDDTP